MKTSISDRECKKSRKAPKNKRSLDRFWEPEMEENRLIHGGQPYRILVVDDEPAIRRLNSDLLMQEGYEVDAVTDGVMAWDILKRNHYDLLITDNLMPKMSGVELLEKLHACRRFVSVIMATGTMPAEEVKSQPWFQIATVLLKPYTLQELLEAVRNSLRLSSRVCFAA
jgi:two-component system, OmpR family, alkaline phosphatase synthesis response regulator PhoP